MTRLFVLITVISALSLQARATDSFANCLTPDVSKMLGADCSPLAILASQKTRVFDRGTHDPRDPTAVSVGAITHQHEVWKITIRPDAICQAPVDHPGQTMIEINRDAGGRIISLTSTYVAAAMKNSRKPTLPSETAAKFSYVGGRCQIEQLRGTNPSAPGATMVNFDRPLCENVMRVVRAKPVSQLQEGERKRIITYLNARSFDLTQGDDEQTYLLPYHEAKDIPALVKTCDENGVTAAALDSAPHASPGARTGGAPTSAD